MEVLKIEEFGSGGRIVSTLWLSEQVSILRRELGISGKGESVPPCTFLKWRKVIGGQARGVHKLYLVEAVAIVYLAVYPKLGKPYTRVAATDLPSGNVLLNEYIIPWLALMASKVEAGTQSSDIECVYTLLCMVRDFSKPLKQMLAEKTPGLPSLSTLKRRANGLGIKLSINDPLPKQLRKELMLEGTL